MSIFLFLLSFLSLAAGFIFIYKPAWIVKANKIIREHVFNDTIILFDRRKKGFFFLLLFIIFFYWGYSRLQGEHGKLQDKLVSADRLLYDSFHSLENKDYAESKRLCETAISMEPQNAKAHYQLAAALYLLKDPAGAKKAWAQAVAINPASYEADRMRKLVVRQLKLPSEDIAAFK
ncbi:MAG: hypothetical protein A2901_03360 [Elusimicrobia bacterium RIFCSPLOWO2_01_FULL_54_10]|nr:MAG: hypothetical protein A2901_03360 [Elusimicrobia bacterium RIFCSPLOWO2_01_FULL_54_10]